jgi:hypothetical protein
MNPHLQNRQGGAGGCINHGLAGRIPSPTIATSALPGQICERSAAQPPCQHDRNDERSGRDPVPDAP